MKRRFRMSKGASRKTFSKTADRVNPKNLNSGTPMRGGFRF